LDRYAEEHGMVFRFIIGHSIYKDMEAKLAAEEQQYNDFLRLPMVENYTALPYKARSFLNAVGIIYQADWVVKLDDKVYLMPERLPLVAQQWAKIGAGYVGCMARGDVHDHPKSKWYEPRHLLFGKEYSLHALASTYILSGDVVERVVVRNFDNLRLLNNEGTMVGLWMLSHDVTFFEDRRVCVKECVLNGVVLSGWCAGLCEPIKDMYTAHAVGACRKRVKGPLRYIHSDAELQEFERMWV
jgi:hypothetical protein